MKKKKMIFWILLVFFFGIFFIKEQYMLYQLNKVKRANQEKLNMIKAENKQLQNDVKLSKRDEYIENLAREKLGLIKPGEILFIDKDKKGQ